MTGSLLSRLRPAMPLALDVAGLALLSVAAGMLALAAGVAAAGVGCLLIGWRVAR